jgi:hypothetical protein
MPITILDYVKSVVGDKDLYTAEDCLASGVAILGGCQGRYHNKHYKTLAEQLGRAAGHDLSLIHN